MPEELRPWLDTPPARRADADPRLSQGGGDFAPSSPSTTYEAASMARRLSPWRPGRAHINTALQNEGPLLRARSRSLIANSPYGANASETFAGYATGTGITPLSLVEDEALAAEIDELFEDWTDEADADGLTDFYGLQTLVTRGCYDAGEMFVRERPRYLRDGLTVPVQYQLIESEQLDSSFTTTAANGNPIRMGIEFDQIGRRVAYHFWRVHPGDTTMLNFTGERTIVPAEQVCHVYKPLRAGQIRGRPWLTAAMVKLYDLDQYDDAELARKKGAAMFMAFLLKKLDPEAADRPPFIEGASEPDQTGTADLMMEPNIMNILPEGFDVKFNEPADVGPNYDAFYKRQLYAVSGPASVPYHALSGDVSQANFSSLRAARIETKLRVSQFQWECLIFQLCRAVRRRWLETAVLAGALKIPGFAANKRVMSRTLWITPKWESVQPLEDAQSDVLRVSAGFKDRGDVILESGENPASVDRRIARTRARARAMELPDFSAASSKLPPAPATTTPSTPEGGGGGGNQQPGQGSDQQQGQAA